MVNLRPVVPGELLEVRSGPGGVVLDQIGGVGGGSEHPWEVFHELPTDIL